ncbi:MAG: universal stress protein [Alicyclobacillus sp.]|nr:universal stress protein [Alicyclobacillus sp.]
MKILLALDQFHNDSNHVQMAKTYLAQISDSTLTVLYVSNESASVYYRTPIGIQHVVTERELAYRDALERSVSQAFAPWGARVSFRHEIGNPVKVICEVADEGNYDLIILGHPRSRLEAVNLRSVMHGVVNHAHRPVLVANGSVAK